MGERATYESDRIDPDTGEPLRAGVLTRAELAAWLAAGRRHWRAALCGALPPSEGEWARAHAAGGMHAMIGWVRRRAAVKGKKARAR